MNDGQFARPSAPWRAGRRNLRSPSHQRCIRLMEEQFIHLPVRAEMELHPEALRLVDDEGSALVGTEFAGWLAPNCQRELSIVVLRDDNSRDSMESERAGAVLTEGRIRAIAGWNAGEERDVALTRPINYRGSS